MELYNSKPRDIRKTSGWTLLLSRDSNNVVMRETTTWKLNESVASPNIRGAPNAEQLEA
jgi:hypothetical protein